MIKINLRSPVPIYEQLVSEIKNKITAEELLPGDSLPTIRALASQLDVAVNTVARAYRELERLDLIDSTRLPFIIDLKQKDKKRSFCRA